MFQERSVIIITRAGIFSYFFRAFRCPEIPDEKMDVSDDMAKSQPESGSEKSSEDGVACINDLSREMLAEVLGNFDDVTQIRMKRYVKRLNRRLFSICMTRRTHQNSS